MWHPSQGCDARHTVLVFHYFDWILSLKCDAHHRLWRPSHSTIFSLIWLNFVIKLWRPSHLKFFMKYYFCQQSVPHVTGCDARHTLKISENYIFAIKCDGRHTLWRASQGPKVFRGCDAHHKLYFFYFSVIFWNFSFSIGLSCVFFQRE